MHFVVDQDNKIIFGWSAKCGCSHVKYIYWFLKTGNLTNKIHSEKSRNPLPNDIQNYTTLLFTRNPYERLVSGFLDKYARPKGKYRNRWKDPVLSFSLFVDKLVAKDWKTIDKHHIGPQTEEAFDKRIFLSKHIRVYDIKNIDYRYIEHLYNKQIPEGVINKTFGHERRLRVKENVLYDTYVYDLPVEDYFQHSVDIKYFYNEEIKQKVYDFFVNDFTMCNEYGIDYTQTTF